MQRKTLYAGVASSSFAKGAELLDHLADLRVPTKQVERLTRTIGSERVAQRDDAVAAFEALPLTQKFEAPAGVSSPELAVIETDGGRLQIRERHGKPDAGATLAEGTSGQTEEDFDEGPARKGFWREDKIGVLLEMKSDVCTEDPCPEIPPGFIDELRIPMLAREIGKVAGKHSVNPCAG